MSYLDAYKCEVAEITADHVHVALTRRRHINLLICIVLVIIKSSYKLGVYIKYATLKNFFFKRNTILGVK